MSASGRINREASLLRDAVFAASDGVVTTFAVVAGSIGGGLAPNVVLILGFANLLADGFSMAAGIYLGARSEADYEREQRNSHWRQDVPVLQGVVTYFAFVASGVVSLLPYLLKFEPPFYYSTLFMIAFLLIVGVIRSGFTHKNLIRGAFEMLFVGGFAAVIAYLIGNFVRSWIS